MCSKAYCKSQICGALTLDEVLARKKEDCGRLDGVCFLFNK